MATTKITNQQIETSIIRIIKQDTATHGNCQLSLLKSVFKAYNISERRLTNAIERLMNDGKITVKVINQKIHFTA